MPPPMINTSYIVSSSPGPFCPTSGVLPFYHIKTPGKKQLENRAPGKKLVQIRQKKLGFPGKIPLLQIDKWPSPWDNNEREVQPPGMTFGLGGHKNPRESSAIPKEELP
jgi:hypothetical protein